MNTQLSENGYIVVPNILSTEECNDTINKIWTWLSNLETGIDRNNPNTWTAKYWPPSRHGIIHKIPVGMEEFAWNVRSHPNVIDVFQKIWNTDDLLSSFDSIGISKPPELLGQRKIVDKSWYHIDQSSDMTKSYCIQSFVNLLETTEKDSCFCCIPQSNNYFQEFITENNLTHKENWYQLNQKDLDWFAAKGLHPVKVTAPTGSMVLWDSRTIHCNSMPVVPRNNPTFRYTVYVCMTPRSWATEETLQQRIKAYEENRMSTHIPHEFSLYPLDNYLGEDNLNSSNNLQTSNQNTLYNIRTKPIVFSKNQETICKKLIGY